MVRILFFGGWNDIFPLPSSTSMRMISMTKSDIDQYIAFLHTINFLRSRSCNFMSGMQCFPRLFHTRVWRVPFESKWVHNPRLHLWCWGFITLMVIRRESWNRDLFENIGHHGVKAWQGFNMRVWCILNCGNGSTFVEKEHGHMGYFAVQCPHLWTVATNFYL